MQRAGLPLGHCCTPPGCVPPPFYSGCPFEPEDLIACTDQFLTRAVWARTLSIMQSLWDHKSTPSCLPYRWRCTVCW